VLSKVVKESRGVRIMAKIVDFFGKNLNHRKLSERVQSRYNQTPYSDKLV